MRWRSINTRGRCHLWSHGSRGLQPGLPTQPLCSSLMEATLYCHVCHMLLFHTSQDSLWIDSSFILIVIRSWPIMHLSFFVRNPWCVQRPFNIMVRYSAERIVCCCFFCFIALSSQKLASLKERQNLFYTFSGSAFCASLQTPLAHENRWKGNCIPVTCSFVCWTTQVCLSVKFLPICQVKAKTKSEKVKQHGPASPTSYCNTFVKCRF